jgi:hypothetical protein
VEAFKEFFRLDHILRNCIGGIAFYLVIYWEIQPDFDLGGYFLRTPIPWANLTVIVIAVSLTGILLHAMERNSIAIVAENLRRRVVDIIEEKKRLQWVFPEKAKEESVWRFHQLSLDDRMSRLTSWGASAHCLYTVSLAIFAAAFWLLLACPSDYSYSGFLSYFPVELVFLLLGFLSDVRKTLMERELAKTLNQVRRSGEPS